MNRTRRKPNSLRLSKIDLMPDAAIPALQDAFDRLQAQRETQADIWEDLTRSLTALEIDPPSFAAFNRWALKIRDGHRRRPTLPSDAVRQAVDMIEWGKHYTISEETAGLLFAATNAIYRDLKPLGVKAAEAGADAPTNAVTITEFGASGDGSKTPST